jgi:hypothetical protein
MRALLLSATLATLLGGTARADEARPVALTQAEEQKSFESPRDFYLEFNGGRYTPRVDSAAGLNGTPYQDIFGNKKMWIFGAEFDWEIWSGFGTVAAGLAVDYSVVYGHGIVALTRATAPDLTILRAIPIRLLGVYRLDVFARRWGVPLIPFGKVGLSDTIWWINDGTGGIARFQDGNAQDRALGGKWGYELAAGLALELNWIDSNLSRELDQEFGVNSVNLQAQYARITADNFGRGGIDLTANTFLFGLGFEF